MTPSELNKKVAVDIMGWKPGPGKGTYWGEYGLVTTDSTKGKNSFDKFIPAENISDAWMVLLKLSESQEEGNLALEIWGKDSFAITGGFYQNTIAESDSAPMAIVLSALKTLEDK